MGQVYIVMYDASIFLVCWGAGLEPLSPDVLYAYVRITTSSEQLNDFPSQFLGTPCAIQLNKPLATCTGLLQIYQFEGHQ